MCNTGLMKVETTISDPKVHSIVRHAITTLRLARSLLMMPWIFLLSQVAQDWLAHAITHICILKDRCQPYPIC
jgi:hypothetical protein